MFSFKVKFILSPYLKKKKMSGVEAFLKFSLPVITWSLIAGASVHRAHFRISSSNDAWTRATDPIVVVIRSVEVAPHRIEDRERKYSPPHRSDLSLRFFVSPIIPRVGCSIFPKLGLEFQHGFVVFDFVWATCNAAVSMSDWIIVGGFIFFFNGKCLDSKVPCGVDAVLFPCCRGCW